MDGTDQNVSSIDNEAVINEKVSPTSSDLSQTLLNINSSLGCMSDLLMKLVANSERTASVVNTQSTTGLLSDEFDARSTGQSEFLSTRHDDPLVHIESSSTGHEAHMFNEHSIKQPSVSTGISRGKRRIGPVYSSKSSKRVCIDDSDDEALSIHANDDEHEFPLSEAVAELISDNNRNDPSKEGESFLDDLQKALETPSEEADDINQKLADIINSRWGKVLSQEKLSPILEKYNRPGNCTSLHPIKVNKEAWANLSADKKQQDLRLANLQQTLEKVAIIVLRASEFLFEIKAHVSSVNSDVTSLVDALALLGHATANISVLRRSSLKPALKREYQALCANNSDFPHGPLLFGEDFGKMVKDVEEARKLNRAFKISPSSAQQSSHYNLSKHGKFTRSYPTGAMMNGPTGTASHRDFLWGGHQRPSFRRKPYNRPQNQKNKPQGKQF